MKKYILFILVFVFSTTLLIACPYCGCGNSNFQVGILPTYKSAFIGVRYTYTHFNTLSNDGTQFSHDYFHSTEIWGGYKIGKFQVMGFLPYLTSHKMSDDGDINDHGLGDATLLANYEVFSFSREGKEGKKALTNTLWLGAGIKFHTGKSEVDVNNSDFTVGDFSSTPGTGSTDYLLNAMHMIVVGNHGIVTNATYRINTENTQQFKYGNRLYANAAYFHSWPIGAFTLRPSLGLNLVVNGLNRYQGADITGTKGYVLSGVAGINLQYGKVGLVTSGFLPVSQDLFQGQTKLHSRGTIGLTYSF